MHLLLNGTVVFHRYRTARVVPIATLEGQGLWEAFEAMALMRGYRMDNHVVLENKETGLGVQCSDGTLTFGRVIRESW
jgi:hypothetical protein